MARWLAVSIVAAAACNHPGEHHTSVPKVARDAGADGRPVPRELVDRLPPLHPHEPLCDGNYHRERESCIPPPREGARLPMLPPVAPEVADVFALARDGTGSRVRFTVHDWRFGTAWRVTFIDPQGHELPNGACTISSFDDEAAECVTALAPEDIRTVGGGTFELKVSPPPELVEHVDADRARNAPLPTPRRIR